MILSAYYPALDAPAQHPTLDAPAQSCALPTAQFITAQSSNAELRITNSAVHYCPELQRRVTHNQQRSSLLPRAPTQSYALPTAQFITTRALKQERQSAISSTHIYNTTLNAIITARTQPFSNNFIGNFHFCFVHIREEAVCRRHIANISINSIQHALHWWLSTKLSMKNGQGADSEPKATKKNSSREILETLTLKYLWTAIKYFLVELIYNFR